MSEPKPGQLARGVVLVHVFAVAALGQAYGKVKLPFGAFPTEAAVFISFLTAMPLIRALPRDIFSKLTLAFVAIGVGWLVLEGPGSSGGAGVKAFSFFVYSALYFVVRATFTTDEERWRLLKFCAAAAFVGTGIGLWQMQSLEPLLTSTFEETSTGSIRWLPGEFALYALLAIVIVVVPMILQRKFDSRSGIVLAFGAGELILAQHRSGFVALAVALIATATFLAGSTQALKGLVKVIAVVTIGLVIFAYTIGSGYLDETINRISSVNDTTDVNISWRLLSWYEVIDGIRAQPWGHGFAHWDFLFTAVDPLTGSHNSFLDLTYRIGVQGAAVFLALPVLLIKQTRRCVQQTEPTKNMLLVTICACMMAFLLYASFNVVLETPYMSVFFWILLGLGAGTLSDRNAQQPSTPT